MDSGGISNRKLIKGMSKIGLEDNCLLLIRKGSELAKETTIDQLSEVVTDMGLVNVGILIVDSFADIGKIQEYRLNKIGYYKMNEATRKILEYMEKEKESEKET